MSDLNFPDRVALSEKLLRLKPAVAESVTARFFLRHPDWVERYGERGRKLGIEDANFHISFLAGAVEAGSVESFEDYVRWTTRMLGARNIASHFLVENLEQIATDLALELTAGEAAAVAAFTRAGCVAAATSAAAPLATGGGAELALARRLYLQAILKNHRRAAVAIVMEALRDGHQPIDIYVEVFQESLYEVGRLWEANRITVAEEHMATAITQYAVAQLYPQLPLATRARGTMVMTGVAGELHQVGANMVADMLDAQGFTVHFLGTNMPHSAILKTVEEHSPSVLGISATMLFNIPHVVDLVAAVRATLGDRAPRIVLGGAAFRCLTTVPDDLRAIGFAPDVRAAVSLLCPDG